MVLPLLAAIIPSLVGAAQARRAGQDQANAANQQMQLSRETRDMIMSRLDPFYQSGMGANAALDYEMGLGARPADYRGFQQTPGYEFARQQGMSGIQGSAAARGSLFSGDTLRGLSEYNTGLANQEYGNYLGRLMAMTQGGMGAATGQATALTNAAMMSNDAMSARGNALAAGRIGMANALSDGVGNALGVWQYQQQLNSQNGLRPNQLWSLP